MEIEDLKLNDVIESSALRSLMESFSEATGMSAAALGKDEDVSSSTYWCGQPDFCANCVKRSTMGAEHCKTFSRKLIDTAKHLLRPATEVCRTGAAEFAVPVVVRGVCVGVIIGGQVFTTKPNERQNASNAKNLGISATEYSAAAGKMEVMPEQRVAAAAELLSQMVSEMAESGYMRTLSAKRAEEARIDLDGASSASAFGQKISDAVNAVECIERDCEHIKEAVARSVKSVDNTDAFVKTIENASTQLTLIGFNASIEAKRAGSAGAGFNVIAQEVRTLADKNSKQATEIEHTLAGIKKSMNEINNQIRTLFSDIENISDSMNDISVAAAEAEKAAQAAHQ